MTSVVSLTEAQVLDALRGFIQTIVRPGTEVIKAQGNRVPQPRGYSFIVMTPRAQRRLSYDQDVYDDVTIVGSIAQGAALFTAGITPSTSNPGYAEMAVTAVSSGLLVPGGLVSAPNVMPGTRIVSQMALNTGGVGIYFVDTPQSVPAGSPMREDFGILTVSDATLSAVTVGSQIQSEVWPDVVAPSTFVTAAGPSGSGIFYLNNSQTVASQAMTAGIVGKLAQTEYRVQLDIYGPRSFDDTRAIDTLFRSWNGVSFIGEATAWEAVPLYCDEARQAPLIDGEQQYEYRWTMEAVLQINPVVSVSQQFFDQIVIDAIIVPIPPAQTYQIEDQVGNILVDQFGNNVVWLT